MVKLGSILYLGQVHLLLSLSLLAFVWVCRTSRLFQFNRFLLLGLVLFSFGLPLVPQVRRGAIQHAPLLFSPISQPSHAMPLHMPSKLTHLQLAKLPALLSFEDYVGYFASFYMVVAAALGCLTLLQLLRLMLFLKKTRAYEAQGLVYHYATHPQQPPFSLFKHIVIHPDHPDLPYILAHERVHARQYHSLDVWLITAVSVLLWINPLTWMLRRAAKLNLEYLVDEELMRSGVDRKGYQYSLLRGLTLQAEALLPLGNHFHSSALKKRIEMMNQAQPRGYMPALKYMWMLPLLGVAYGVNMPLQKRAKIIQSLHLLEGVYQAEEDKTLTFQVQQQGTKLKIKQLWDGEETIFDPLAQPSSTGPAPSAPLTFIPNGKKGQQIRALSFTENNQFYWKKMANQPLQEPARIMLSPAQLAAYEGYYRIDDGGENYFGEIKAEADGLVLRIAFDSKVFHFEPESPTRFFVRGINFPIEFMRNSANGAVTHMVTYNEFKWEKIAATPLLDKKEVQNEPADNYARYEGIYSFHSQKENKEYRFQIVATDKALQLIQFWNGKTLRFTPHQTVELYKDSEGEHFRYTSLEFDNAEFRLFLRFNQDNLSVETKLTPYDGVQKWSKVKGNDL